MRAARQCEEKAWTENSCKWHSYSKVHNSRVQLQPIPLAYSFVGNLTNASSPHNEEWTNLHTRCSFESPDMLQCLLTIIYVP